MEQSMTVNLLEQSMTVMLEQSMTVGTIDDCYVRLNQIRYFATSWIVPTMIHAIRRPGSTQLHTLGAGNKPPEAPLNLTRTKGFVHHKCLLVLLRAAVYLQACVSRPSVLVLLALMRADPYQIPVYS